MAFLSHLPSTQLANSKKPQFIVFVNAIFLDRARVAKSSLFDRVSIRRSTNITFLNAFSSTYHSKSSTVVIHFEISRPPSLHFRRHRGSPKPNFLTPFRLANTIRELKKDAMIFQVFCLSPLSALSLQHYFKTSLMLYDRMSHTKCSIDLADGAGCSRSRLLQDKATV
jgi:hypothetical protein